MAAFQGIAEVSKESEGLLETVLDLLEQHIP